MHWLLELFSHFPLQYLALQALAAGLCLALRRWVPGVVVLLAAVPNLVAIASYLPGLLQSTTLAVTAGAPTAPAVELIAYNLRYSNDDPAATRAYLDRRSPDLLVLSEFTPRWHEFLQELELRYPYFAVRPRWNPWGIAVYSKYPLGEIENLDLGDDQSSHLRVLVNLPGGPLEVYAVHLVSPSSSVQAGRRNTQLRKLAALIAAADSSLPKIVAGDFNATPYSPLFQDLLRDSGLRDGRQAFGLQVTWPAWPVPLWIPIDHCLASAGVVVTRVAIGPRTGSDHWPLECGFTLPQSSMRKLRN